MMPSENSPTAMFSDLEPDLPASGGDDYRRLSSLAVVAFVLGLLSVTAFISPYFFIFPVAAIGACLAAFNAVQRSDGTLTGKRLAAAGLALAVALTAAAQTRVVVRDRIYRREAAAAAAQWLDLLAPPDRRARGRARVRRQLARDDRQPHGHHGRRRVHRLSAR